MRLSRFLCFTLLLTCLSLLYVYEQTEIFRLAYVGGKKEVIFNDLLDKNSILRYNIGRNTSLTNIGYKISKSADFQMPDTYRLVRLNSRQGPTTKEQLPKETILTRIFGIKRQAEARTIKP